MTLPNEIGRKLEYYWSIFSFTKSTEAAKVTADLVKEKVD